MKTSRLLAWAFLPWITVSLVAGFFTFRNVHPDPVLYPPAAQARADLAAALRQAPLAHKRVLLDFGWSSCGDCQAMDRYMHDPVNRAPLDSNFIVVFINTDNDNPHDYTNANEDLAHQYAVPLDKGVPALAVLDEDGKLIFSQQKGEFEDMRHLKSTDLTAFLMHWK
jgi:thioredoxin-related protein